MAYDKKKKYSKGGKGSYSGKSNSNASDPSAKTSSGSGSQSTHSPLITEAGQLQFNWPLGANMPAWSFLADDNIREYRTVSEDVDNNLPGIMTIHCTAAPGVSADRTSPLNLATYRMFARIRKSNMGATNYEAPDLMMMILAMDSAYSIWAHCLRAYGLARIYAQTNRYYPKALLRVMGFDADDLQKNLADFRYRMNVLAKKLSAIAIPANLEIIKRHFGIYQAVFTDGDTPQSQMYVYIPENYFAFSPIKYETGTCLELRSTPISANDPSNYRQWMQFVEGIVNSLIENQTINIMSGDILRAYGAENCQFISGFESDYETPIGKSDVELTRIMNSTTVGEFDPDATITRDTGNGNSETFYRCDVVQDPIHGITWEPFLLSSDAGADVCGYMNFMDSVPSAEEVTECMRHMANVSLRSLVDTGVTGDAPTFSYKLESCCSEIVHFFKLWKLYYDDGDVRAIPIAPYETDSRCMTHINPNGGMTMNQTKFIAYLSMFDYHPQVFLSSIVEDNNAEGPFTLNIGVPCFEAGICRRMAYPELERGHLALLLQDYEVPYPAGT